jgi:hypothetical protein
MHKGKKRKKPCRSHQDKITFDPISKGIAQRRNTQMKPRKDNAKEKDKAKSCRAAYRQQKQKQKRTTLIPTLNPARATTFFFPRRFPCEPQAITKREARKKFFIALPFFPRGRSSNISFSAFPLNLKRVHEARSAENFLFPCFPYEP